MLYIMPVFTVFIGVSLPAGLTLYWVVTTLMAIFQQWLFLRKGSEVPVSVTTNH
jgi:membrane protein insertase Oxa1/YidC/SpoIIIJ